MADNLRYPLAATTWDEAELEAVQAVLRSGQFTMGETVREFESAFARFVGSRYAVMVNSGSSANLLMIAALVHRNTRPLARGDEIIVPAVSWPTTYAPAYQYGLRLKFVDIDAATLNFDLAALQAAISPRTRAVFAVNLLGNPNDFAAIGRLLAGRGIDLVEDNCESLGATFEGRQAGTFGVMGSFSFYFSHHMSTMEGGMVVTDDEEHYHFLLALRAHGWTRNLPAVNRVCGTKSDDAFEESFRFVVPGYNLRPTEINAAIGLRQLAKLPEFLRVRRGNARRFRSRFADHPSVAIQAELGESSWFGFALLLRPGGALARSELAARLQAAGVECRPIVAGNFAKNPVMKWFDHEIAGDLPNASWIDSSGLFAGNHHFDLTKQIDALAGLVGEAFAARL
ncbi:MAG: DegT/DnrJ/EryC1/StrS family aminotransferase [Burkholderiales bacterium]|nr:DegT/DnrJ/EryC1/StrS family aminotransferase [Burkholderiales bacterium]